jgi:hypothetical protein
MRFDQPVIRLRSHAGSEIPMCMQLKTHRRKDYLECQ